jgi:ubiquinone/menaquinone biosynthesis C-methylase UbiE
LEQFPPQGHGAIVEIGAGDGQLKEWMPSEVAARTVHTEPLGLALRELRKRWPDASTRQASVERLPFGDGEVATVLASCVLDVVPDGSAAAHEIARVLRPGGHLIHLLDLSTELTGCFDMFRQASLVPVPNVFGDSCEVRWPEDMFLIPREQVHGVVDVLQRHGHWIAKPLRKYVLMFDANPFPLRHAMAAYAGLAESLSLRTELRSVFRDARELADPVQRKDFAGFHGQPAASSRYFQSRLNQWFGDPAVFKVLLSDIVSCAQAVPIQPDCPVGYMSLCAGEIRKLSVPPAALLNSHVGQPTEGESLRELGIFVFVAERI